jgi:hypothetical protein
MTSSASRAASVARRLGVPAMEAADVDLHTGRHRRSGGLRDRRHD